MADRVQGDRQLIARLDAVGRAMTPRVLLRRWQVRTTQLAKVNVAPHKRTGALQRSIHPGWNVGTRAQVVADAAHAVFIEKGTRPHLIRPRSARVLAWNNTPGANRLSGARRSGVAPNVFARLVRHPGTQADPFLEPAARQALGELDADPVVRAWNGAA